MAESLCTDQFHQEYAGRYQLMNEDDELAWNITATTPVMLVGEFVKQNVGEFGIKINRVSAITGSCVRYGFRAQHVTCTHSKFKEEITIIYVTSPPIIIFCFIFFRLMSIFYNVLFYPIYK